jgi:hypothetical protein
VESSVSAAAWWTILGIVVAVAIIAGVLLARAGREVLRIRKRLEAYADLPIVAAVAQAEVDAGRLEVALVQIEPLIARAEAALSALRRGPIPPEVAGSVAFVSAELRELRELTI